MSYLFTYIFLALLGFLEHFFNIVLYCVIDRIGELC